MGGSEGRGNNQTMSGTAASTIRREGDTPGRELGLGSRGDFGGEPSPLTRPAWIGRAPSGYGRGGEAVGGSTQGRVQGGGDAQGGQTRGGSSQGDTRHAGHTETANSPYGYVPAEYARAEHAMAGLRNNGRGPAGQGPSGRGPSGHGPSGRVPTVPSQGGRPHPPFSVPGVPFQSWRDQEAAHQRSNNRSTPPVAPHSSSSANPTGTTANRPQFTLPHHPKHPPPSLAQGHVIDNSVPPDLLRRDPLPASVTGNLTNDQVWIPYTADGTPSAFPQPELTHAARFFDSHIIDNIARATYPASDPRKKSFSQGPRNADLREVVYEDREPQIDPRDNVTLDKLCYASTTREVNQPLFTTNAATPGGGRRVVKAAQNPQFWDDGSKAREAQRAQREHARQVRQQQEDLQTEYARPPTMELSQIVYEPEEEERLKQLRRGLPEGWDVALVPEGLPKAGRAFYVCSGMQKKRCWHRPPKGLPFHPCEESDTEKEVEAAKEPAKIEKKESKKRVQPRKKKEVVLQSQPTQSGPPRGMFPARRPILPPQRGQSGQQGQMVRSGSVLLHEQPPCQMPPPPHQSTPILLSQPAGSRPSTRPPPSRPPPLTIPPLMSPATTSPAMSSPAMSDTSMSGRGSRKRELSHKAKEAKANKDAMERMKR